MSPVIVVCKITYPNERIFVGHDRTDSINYLGSASSALITADFPQPRAATGLHDRAGDPLEVRHGHAGGSPEIELAMFREHRSNYPSIGYDRWPRPRPAPKRAESTLRPVRSPDPESATAGLIRQQAGKLERHYRR